MRFLNGFICFVMMVSVFIFSAETVLAADQDVYGRYQISSVNQLGAWVIDSQTGDVYLFNVNENNAQMKKITTVPK